MRGPLPVVALLLVTGVLSGCLFDDPTPGEFEGESWLLLVNGKVWTADDTRPWASFVAIVGDRIAAVGDDAQAIMERLGGDPTIIDLGGRLVTPGFHDTHNHFVRDASVLDAETWETNPYEPWPAGWDPVVGNVNQNRIALNHIATWGNGNVARIEDGRLPDPPAAEGHGHDHHDDEEGHDHLWSPYADFAPKDRTRMTDVGPWPVMMGVETETWKNTLRVALSVANKYGLTSSSEAGAPIEAFDVLQELDGEGGLTARFNLYLFPEHLDTLIAENKTLGHGDDDVRILGLKIYSDGWLGPRTAALREMFNDRPHQGFAFFSQQEIDDYVLKAHQGGLKITAHAIGDRAVDRMITAYEKAVAAGCPEGATHKVCTDPRFSLEHASLAQPDLVARMVDLGLVPSVQLSFPTSDAPWIEQALGEERAAETYRWKTMMDEGLVVAGSSDWPNEVLPPLWGVQRAVTRIDLNGEPPEGFHPEEALTVDQALRTITINAAYLEHRDEELGSITEGKYADLVVLERDLFTIDPKEIAATEVALTMVGGRAVYGSGTVDVPLNQVEPVHVHGPQSSKQ
ncbi:MAG: amidohydrolase [Euryarchaeota archaeon]|nr:amidohydrolase [Euryarchaeota archaeon]